MSLKYIFSCIETTVGMWYHGLVWRCMQSCGTEDETAGTWENSQQPPWGITSCQLCSLTLMASRACGFLPEALPIMA